MDFRPNVVVHFKNGEIKKGHTRDFAFFRDKFHLTPLDKDTREEQGTEEIQVEDLKAVFFVKDFDGNPEYRTNPKAERHGFGKRLEITFHDNETLIGYTHRYQENNNGFIVYPADDRTNNDLVAVIRSATKSIKAEPRHSFFYH